MIEDILKSIIGIRSHKTGEIKDLLETEGFEDSIDSWNNVLVREDKIIIYDPQLDKIIAVYERTKLPQDNVKIYQEPQIKLYESQAWD